MKRLLAFFFLASMVLSGSAQLDKPKNRSGDFSGKKRRFHFGFSLGYNRTSFFHELKPDFTFQDSLLGLGVKPTPGFNLNILSSLHIDNNWKLRFLPGISFQDRQMLYKFVIDGEIETIEHRVESTYIDFPLLLKWRTNRINNWCVYLIGGGQFSVDMASRENVNTNEDVVRIRKTDYAAQIGGGMDFFLPYFKFGVELKLSSGIPNILIPENNMLSDPISRLRSQVWLLSFTFEG